MNWRREGGQSSLVCKSTRLNGCQVGGQLLTLKYMRTETGTSRRSLKSSSKKTRHGSPLSYRIETLTPTLFVI